MSILCKLGFHEWIYKSFLCKETWTEHVTRYCERCERLEKGSKLIASIMDRIVFKKIIN